MGGKYRCSAHSDTHNLKIIESSLANSLFKLRVCSFLSKLLQKIRVWVRRLDRRRNLCSEILPGYSLAWMVSSFSHSSDIIVGVLPVILAATFQLHRFGRSYILERFAYNDRQHLSPTSLKTRCSSSLFRFH